MNRLVTDASVNTATSLHATDNSMQTVGEREHLLAMETVWKVHSHTIDE